jgi:type II secretory pathway component GspD/PulD (secretin)
VLSAVCALAQGQQPSGQSQLSYCNITQLTWASVSNGVTITLRSDGILDWERSHGFSERFATRIPIRLPQARSKLGKSTFDIKSFPVSHVTVTPSAGAEMGIGLDVTVYTHTAVDFKIDRSANQRNVMIMVNKPYTLESRNGEAAAQGPEVEKKLDVQCHDGLVDVSAVKANLHELLGQLAKSSGTNIAVDDAAQRQVTMSLRDLPVADVIRGIASAYGLAVSEADDCFRLSEGVPDTLATYNVSSTQSFPIKYLRAANARALLPNFLFNYVNTNYSQNAVVATAPTQMLEKIGRDLEKVDQPPPQIMIEALAVEFTTTGALDLGLNYSDLNSTFERTLNTLDGALSYRTVGKLPEDFLTRVTALAKSGKARIYANPRMAVVNGQAAEIHIGEQRFIKVQYIRYGQQQEKIQGVDVGVKLKVQPWTGGNGEITLDIEPSVSNIQEIDEQTGLPVLSTRRANVDLRVKDGETVVIGGLTLEQEFKTKSKIPILGDIPLLGELFTSRRTSKVNSELAIFVTPHILTDRGRLPDEETENRIRDQFLGEQK